jgi:hypothetical protein
VYHRIEKIKLVSWSGFELHTKTKLKLDKQIGCVMIKEEVSEIEKFTFKIKKWDD